jgi:hypothetical protein
MSNFTSTISDDQYELQLDTSNGDYKFTNLHTHTIIEEGHFVEESKNPMIILFLQDLGYD